MPRLFLGNIKGPKGDQGFQYMEIGEYSPYVVATGGVANLGLPPITYQGLTTSDCVINKLESLWIDATKSDRSIKGALCTAKLVETAITKDLNQSTNPTSDEYSIFKWSPDPTGSSSEEKETYGAATGARLIDDDWMFYVNSEQRKAYIRETMQLSNIGSAPAYGGTQRRGTLCWEVRMDGSGFAVTRNTCYMLYSPYEEQSDLNEMGFVQRKFKYDLTQIEAFGSGVEEADTFFPNIRLNKNVETGVGKGYKFPYLFERKIWRDSL